jgi:hypothetical protein
VIRLILNLGRISDQDELARNKWLSGVLKKAETILDLGSSPR